MAGLLDLSMFATLEKIARVVFKQYYILNQGNFANVN